MKVTGIALVPPAQAADNPKATPELLASCLARYSRSNKGIEAILSTVDWQNPDKSVESIFKFVDYGHASIGGLTGGIALAVDGCSMLLAYKLFEFAQYCDGQESSTRYITMGRDSLPAAEAVGIPPELRDRWQALMDRSFNLYHAVYEQLDNQARAQPEIVRVPAGAGPKVIDRLRKNYALDRARYFIPLATKTNAGYVMSARAWAETIRRTEALGWPEAVSLAGMLRTELEKFAPRLVRHSVKDEASTNQQTQELLACREFIQRHGAAITNEPDQVWVKVADELPAFLPNIQSVDLAFAGKLNRYSLAGERIKRSMVRFAWNNIALAELRDLNRHRTGMRFCPLLPVGFYLPAEVKHPDIENLLCEYSLLVKELAAHPAGNGCHFYAYLLGTQTSFEHSTHLDKFIYEAELRTGMGAHFRYAEHLEAAAREFLRQYPEYQAHIEIGTAEPE